MRSCRFAVLCLVGVVLAASLLHAEAREVFRVLALGTSAGDDSSLPAYALSTIKNPNDWIMLDAGTLHAGLAKVESETLTKLVDPSQAPTVTPVFNFIRNRLKAVFLSHQQIDRVTGLAAASPDWFIDWNPQTKDTEFIDVYGLPEMITVLEKHVLNGQTWPPFGTGQFGMNKVHYNIVPPKEVVVPKKAPHLQVTTYPLTHGHWRSSALLVSLTSKPQSGNLLYFGDIGVSHQEELTAVWDIVKGLASAHLLRAIFIECMYEDKPPEYEKVDEHMTPTLIKQQMTILQEKAGEGNLKGITLVVNRIKVSTGNYDRTALIKQQLNAYLESFGIRVVVPKQGQVIQF